MNIYKTNKVLFSLAMVLFFNTMAWAGSFTAQSTSGAIQAWDTVPVAEGSLIELIWVGPDGEIDPPNADEVANDLGAVTDDDVFIRSTHVGNGYITGLSEGRFAKLFTHTEITAGKQVYLRVWDTDVVSSADDSYGDSDIYTIQTAIETEQKDFGIIYVDTFLNGNTHPVELSNFAVESVDGVVNLTWTTQSESQNLGFYIYRAETADGEKQKMNTDMIQGALNSETRNDYTFTDSNVEPEKVYFYWVADVATDGAMTYYGPKQITVTAAPQSYGLDQNYPNPFNPTTSISFTVKKAGQVHLAIYNMLGQVVRELVNDHKAAGSYAVQWNGTNKLGVRVPSGVYFYSLEVNGFRSIRKMMLTK